MECLTKILLDEHQNILKVVRLITSASGNRDKKFFEAIIDFIKNYADRLHHGKEENILFPALCQNPNMHCDPTMQMRYEHDEGRKFVKGMEDGLQDELWPEVIQNAHGYADLLNNHIFKEENILFPMAEDALDEPSKKSILDKFSAHSRENKSEHMRLLSILQELESH